jgi:hypothetical protein
MNECDQRLFAILKIVNKARNRDPNYDNNPNNVNFDMLYTLLLTNEEAIKQEYTKSPYNIFRTITDIFAKFKNFTESKNINLIIKNIDELKHDLDNSISYSEDIDITKLKHRIENNDNYLRELYTTFITDEVKTSLTNFDFQELENVRERFEYLFDLLIDRNITLCFKNNNIINAKYLEMTQMYEDIEYIISTIKLHIKNMKIKKYVRDIVGIPLKIIKQQMKNKLYVMDEFVVNYCHGDK